jgi:hypothetical protein
VDVRALGQFLLSPAPCAPKFAYAIPECAAMCSLIK